MKISLDFMKIISLFITFYYYLIFYYCIVIIIKYLKIILTKWTWAENMLYHYAYIYIYI